MIYDNILGTIGRTPIVKIQRLAPKNITMYVKCEFFNPLGSVKDRLAIAPARSSRARPSWKPLPAIPGLRLPWFAQPRAIPSSR
jgi:cysteine synthase A